MANIAEYLSKILGARYGRDVRQSIHDALDAVNTSATDSAKVAEEAAKNIENVKLQAEATTELMGAVKYDGKTIIKNILGQLKIPVVANLLSTDNELPLAASMGKQLNDELVTTKLTLTGVQKSVSSQATSISYMNTDVNNLKKDVAGLEAQIASVSALKFKLLAGKPESNQGNVLSIPKDGSFMVVFLNERGGNNTYKGGILLLDFSQGYLSHHLLGSDDLEVSSAELTDGYINITLNQSGYWQYTYLQYNSLG